MPDLHHEDMDFLMSAFGMDCNDKDEIKTAEKNHTNEQNGC